jgi:hypothetical protein
MTTIVYRAGVMAADSLSTTNSETGGSRKFTCEKLYQLHTHSRGKIIVGLAGDTFAGLVFMDWFTTGNPLEPPQRLIDGDADFTALVLTRSGLYEYDRWCRGERIRLPFYAVGSGAKAALGALHMGAGARKAVQVACKIDPYSRLPIRTMTL